MIFGAGLRESDFYNTPYTRRSTKYEYFKKSRCL